MKFAGHLCFLCARPSFLPEFDRAATLLLIFMNESMTTVTQPDIIIERGEQVRFNVNASVLVFNKGLMLLTSIQRGFNRAVSTVRVSSACERTDCGKGTRITSVF